MTYFLYEKNKSLTFVLFGHGFKYENHNETSNFYGVPDAQYGKHTITDCKCDYCYMNPLKKGWNTIHNFFGKRHIIKLTEKKYIKIF
jgi:hypothetical protein